MNANVRLISLWRNFLPGTTTEQGKFNSCRSDWSSNNVTFFLLNMLQIGDLFFSTFSFWSLALFLKQSNSMPTNVKIWDRLSAFSGATGTPTLLQTARNCCRLAWHLSGDTPQLENHPECE